MRLTNDGRTKLQVHMQTFDSVIDEHGAVVLRVCRALLQPADADEAWSETFLTAFRTYGGLQDHTNIRGWLVTIAHRKAIDVLRSSNRQPVPVDEIPSDSINWNAVEGKPDEIDIDALRNAIADLPDKQRRAVTYRYIADLSYADIGALLECSQPAARRNVSDALASLRKNRHTYVDQVDSKGIRT
jgi:RNA polymerase sigma factor (sigma-70 family)